MTNPFRAAIQATLRVLCTLRGHDALLKVEHRRISLRCVTCGHETTGWTIGGPPSSAKLEAPTAPVPAEARHAA